MCSAIHDNTGTASSTFRNLTKMSVMNAHALTCIGRFCWLTWLSIMVCIVCLSRPVVGTPDTAGLSLEVVPPVDDQLQALIRIKGYIDPTGKLITWKNGENKTYCQSWFGVSCLENSTVSSIKIVYVGADSLLVGQLPPAAAFKGLPGLQEITIANQNISGTLPPSWGQLKQLKRIDLKGNKLISGTLPDAYKILTALEVLNLGRNNLTGTMPSSWGRLKKLKELAVYDNKLTGPLPVAYKTLTALEKVYLGGNNLTGTLPPAWGRLKLLSELELQGNKLTGPLPPEWGQLKQLEFFMLANNNLVGPVPPRWSNMVSALGLSQYVDLTDNPSLTGCLPRRWRDRIAVDFDGTAITGYC